jgi:TolB-like protein/AraC-like DNA-binding protein
LNKIVFTDQSLLDSLYKTIEENLLNEQFGVEELARELGISRSQLHRQLHDLTGKSTSQVIREYRLEKARELLENETATVAEVSYQVGFGSPSYFNTCFHEYFGYTPGEVKFRKTLEKKKRPRASKKFILLSLSILAISALIYYSWSPTGVKVDKISEPLIPDKSIAMLPLKYLSEDPSKQYMADGILDAIIGQLSIIKDLRVTPRTTIEQYRETTKTARAIGEELNVTYLIEGSFWMQDDQVRLIIQLVSPQSEDHIWDKEYVSELEDIFAVESEITQTIAKEIGIEISPERTERIESVPTENMDAYELFMKGQHYQNLGPSGKIRAIKYYEQAMALDPDFALPYLYYGWEKFGIRNSDALAKDYGDSVLYYTKKAIELDPDLDIAYYRLGVYYNGLSDDDNAIYYLKKTLDLNPNHARAYMQLGWVYGRMGRYIDKIISLEKGKKLATGNPNNFAILSDQLGDGYIWIGYHEKAEEAYREVLKIDPIKAYSKLGALCMGRGDWDMMKLYTDKLCAIDSGETCSMMLYKFYLHTEDFPKALKYADFHRETGRELDTYEILIQFDKIFRQAEYGYVLSQNNRKAEARVYYDKQIYFCKEGLSLKRAWAMEGESDVALFETYIFLGDHELAIHHLKEYEKKFFGRTYPTYFQVAPQFRPIWENDEFKAIMKRQQKKYADIRAEIDQLEKEGKL